MKSCLLVLLLLLACRIASGQDENSRPWLDHTRSTGERIELLIGAMTLEEKVSQLLNASRAIPRLGIEEYNWWSEALHGVARSAKATVFPQSIALAATFDADLVFRIGAAVSDEARAINNTLAAAGRPARRYTGLTFWSPNVNIFRDPRWGRGQETYGEDPMLAGSMGAAFIRGMQGAHPVYLKVAACAKHFAVHSGPEGERHGFNALAGRKDLEETYLPAFRRCVEAGVEAIMCAYNRTNGEPCCGSSALLRGVLREQWGFAGHVVSDCGAIYDIHTGHRHVGSSVEACALALASGVNLNCGGSYENLPEALERGLITEGQIDESLRLLLRTRFRLGMFDPPELNPYRSIGAEVINCPAHRRLALEAARKSVVLLQNRNGVLPLDSDAGFIHICGPLADRALALVGNYHGLSANMTTVLEGIVGKVSPATRVEFRAGALLSTPNQHAADVRSGPAAEADATIAVVGLTLLLEGEEGETIASGQKGDNLRMSLPESQLDLLRALSAAGKPLVVVICAGSPIDVSEIKDLADAVLLAWYPGERGGQAVADILFGDVSPSGKLPVTFPVSVEQLPPFSDYSMEGRTYRYMTEAPQYPFGFGLSYCDFSFSEMQLDATSVSDGESINASVTVENTGGRAAEEVIQLYIRLDDIDNTPTSQLVAFRRISLDAGEAAEVGFEISPDDLTCVTEDGRRRRYRGAATVYIGNASPGRRSLELGAAILSARISVK